MNIVELNTLMIQNHNGDLLNLMKFNNTIRNYRDCLIENYGDNNLYLSYKLITLEVYRRNYSDLNIIDLPGIIHVNPETEELIKELVIDYIRQSNTIALFTHNVTMNICSDEYFLRLISEVSKNAIFLLK